MLIDFFYTLRAAKLPVSVKEYLTLLEALQTDVVGPTNPDACSMDDFYFLSRTALVKDEKHFDKFDRAFAAYFKGVEMIADFTKPIPADWLRQEMERILSEEQKANAPKLDWDELMETLKKRLEEQKERHEGGSKWIGTGGTSPFGNGGQNPQGIRIGGKGGGKTAVKVWEQRSYRDYDDTQELGTRNIKVALRRLRKFAREGNELELDLPDTIRSTAANAGYLDIKMIPERHNNVKVLLLMDVGGTMERVEELFSAVKSEFKHLEFYYFHNCVYDFMWKNNRRRYAEKFPTWDIIRKYNKDYKQAGVRGRRHHEPLRDPAARRQRGIQQRRGGCRVAAAAHTRLPQVRLDQPRTARRVAVPAEHQHRATAHGATHVPVDTQGLGRRDAHAVEIMAACP